MASGGTRAAFPGGLSALVGSHGANMLNQVRNECAKLLPNARAPLTPNAVVYETYAKVCSYDNPITPELAFQTDGEAPVDPERQAASLDRAAQNAGWMVFGFMRDEASAGNWPRTPNECQAVFPSR